MRLIMRKYFKYIAVIIAVFVADFFSKYYLLSFFANKWGDTVYDANVICAKCNINGVVASWRDLIGGDYGLSNLFNIHFIWNRGVSFSAFNFVMPIVLSVLTAIIILWLIYYLFKKSEIYDYKGKSNYKNKYPNDNLKNIDFNVKINNVCNDELTKSIQSSENQ